MPEDNVKPGIKTTEFWLTLLTALIGTGGLLSGLLPPDVGAAVVLVATSVYGLVRAITKARSS